MPRKTRNMKKMRRRTKRSRGLKQRGGGLNDWIYQVTHAINNGTSEDTLNYLFQQYFSYHIRNYNAHQYAYNLYTSRSNIITNETCKKELYDYFIGGGIMPQTCFKPSTNMGNGQ